MIERQKDYFLKAPEGLDWQQLEIINKEAEINCDAEDNSLKFPGLGGVFSWLQKVPESKVSQFEEILPNFGIKVIYSGFLSD